MKYKYVFILLMISLLTSCKSSEPTPTVTPPPSPTNTLLPTSTSTGTTTPTNTPTQTATPTTTQRPTWTPASPPTATPQGYFASTNFSFSMTVPEHWDIIEESDSVSFGNEQIGLVGFAYSGPLETPPTEDNFTTLIQSLSESWGGQIDSTGVLEIKDGVIADTAVIELTNEANVPVLVNLLYTYQEPQEYLFMIFGNPPNMELNQETINQIFGSIQLLGIQTLGIDRDNALVTSGGTDPDPEDLDPASAASGSGGYVGLLYSGLVSLSPDLQIQPDLAENWIISLDGTVYTFTIRPDAYFQSGRPITADDFKYSIERAADPDTDSPLSVTYLGDIVGFKDKRDGKANEVSGVKVINELVLQITLDGPKPYFLAKLTYPTSFVVDRESVEADPEAWMFSPNASGPFKLRSYMKSDMLIFEPNPGNPHQSGLNALVFRLYLPGKSLDYYQTNELDIAYLGDPEDIKSIQSIDNPLNDELRVTTSLCTSMVMVNNNLPPMDDPNVRKAFALAIDRQKLLDQFSEGTDLFANTILPPAMPGFSSDLIADRFDAQAAKEALQASKYAENMPAVIVYDSGYAGDESEYTNAIVSMWQENLGVTVQVEYLDPPDFSRAAREGKGHLVLFGWCADYPDPENFLDVLFHTGNEFNVARYSNQEIDQLLEQARVELDINLRLQLYKQIETLLLSDHASIPLGHGISYKLVKPYINGYTDTPLHTRVFDRVTIER